MELGSEYSLNLSDLNLVADNVFSYLSGYRENYYFDSGRSAIRHIARNLKNDLIILLPEFICESVIECFPDNNILYYRLKNDFTIDLEDLKVKLGNRPSVIFVMHYFGKVQPLNVLTQVRLLADNSDSLIIEDTTHSIFSQSRTIGDYMVCSIRKWLPIPGGGALYYDQNRVGIDQPAYAKSINNKRCYGMVLKDLFINSGYDCNSEYRQLFRESEDALDEQKGIYEMSDLARFIASCVSVEKIITKRKHNFHRLVKKLKSIGIAPAIAIEDSEVPLTCVLRVPDRDSFRSYLMNKNIYCAVHWPFDGNGEAQRSFAIKNARELISLPIDQRYDDEYMDYLFKTIKQYGGELSY